MIFLRGKWRNKPRPWGPLSAVRNAVFRNCDHLGIQPPVFLCIPGEGWRHEIISGNAPIVYNTVSWQGRTRDGAAVYNAGQAHHVSWRPIPALYDITDTASVIVHSVLTGRQGSYCKILTVPYHQGAWESPYSSFDLVQYSTDTTSVQHSGGGGAVYRNRTVAYFVLDEHHQYAFTRAGADFGLYRDGAVIESRAVDNNATYAWGDKNPVTIHGAHFGGYAPSEGVDGHCSFAGIWDVALTSDQIAQLYDAPYRLVEPTPAPFVSTPTATTLTGSRSSAWRVYTAADIEAAWRVYDEVSTASAWTLFAQSERGGAWRVFAASYAGASWDVLTKSEQGSAWHVEDESGHEAGWSILDALHQATAWTVVAEADAQTEWAILAAGASDVGTAWRILAEDESTTAWRVITDSDASSTWRVFVADSQQVAAHVLADSESATSWKVFAAAEHGALWSVLSDNVATAVQTILATQRATSHDANPRNTDFDAAQRESTIDTTQRTVLFNARARTFIILAKEQ